MYISGMKIKEKQSSKWTYGSSCFVYLWITKERKGRRVNETGGESRKRMNVEGEEEGRWKRKKSSPTKKQYLWINYHEQKSSEHLRTTYGNIGQLFRPHQQCIPWSPPLEIEPATRDCKAKTLQLSQQFISHAVEDKLISHGNCVAN